MTKDDILELEITSFGMDGEGVARYLDFVVFVPMTLVGEKVLAKVVSVKKNFAICRVIKLLKASPLRREPICPIFFSCGGCNMLHIGEEKAREIKRENLVNCLKKQGIFDNVDNVVESDKNLYYRNKMSVPISNQNGSIVLGYYKEKTHNVVPFEKCYLHDEWGNTIAKAFINYANRYKLTAYDERTKKGLLKHLVARKLGDNISIVVVINGDNLPCYDKFCNILKENDIIKFSLAININKMHNNVILSDDTRFLYGKSTMMHEVNGVKVEVSPNSFMQVNDYIASKIYTDVCSRIIELGNPLVLECYSGIGVMTNILAQHGIKVISSEIEPSSVANADKMASLNNNEDRIVNILGDSSLVMPIIKNAIVNHDYKGLDKLNLKEDKLSKVTSILMSFNSKKHSESVKNSSNKTNNNFEKNTSQVQKILEKNISDGVENKAKDYNSREICVLVDPPRKGCHESVLNAIVETSPNYIFYVSCSPATLARDLKSFIEKYEIISITPYDMFPNTSHVETLVCLKRK